MSKGSNCHLYVNGIDTGFKIKNISMETQFTIEIYIDNSLVYYYNVDTLGKAREHADAIIKGGYRHTLEGEDDLEWFPPHRIQKVKVLGAGESSKYKDRVRAT